MKPTPNIACVWLVGIEHLRYLKEHDLLRRAVLLIGVGILVIIAILVLHFGFPLVKSDGLPLTNYAYCVECAGVIFLVAQDVQA